MLTLLALVLVFLEGFLCQNPIVHTPSGPVQGFTLTTYSGKEVDAFFGVPYAKPPVGERKFKKPEPVEPWTETLKAFNVPKSCPRQPHAVMLDVKEQSDDCLYLTIAVPKGTTPDKKLPVLAKIHGGAFQGGSVGVDWGNSTTLVAEENVIIAAMNYRLGFVGFFYMDSENAPGNMGLWDQSLALKWIKENIASFGGDPDSITLIGESAGAGSVSFHTLTDYSRPNFNRAILESGAANAPWAIQDKKVMLDLAQKMAEQTGCVKKSSEETIACLREVDSDTLMSESEKIKIDELLNLGFVPIVDGDFVKKHPLELMKDGDFKKCEYLTGAADEEGVIFAKGFLAGGDMTGQVTITRDDITKFSNYLAPNRDPLIRDVIEYLYTNWTNPDLIKNWWDSADKIFGDYYFGCGVADFSDFAAQYGLKVYRHVFGEKIAFLGADEKYAFHASQIGFIFGPVFDKNNQMIPYNPKYEETARRVMRTRANFARTGDPNKSPDGSSPDVEWPEYTLDSKKYIFVTAEEDTVDYGYRDLYCAFWRDLLPKLEKERESCPV